MSRQPARNKDPESSVVSESLFTNICLYCFFSLESGTWVICDIFQFIAIFQNLICSIEQLGETDYEMAHQYNPILKGYPG